VHPTIVLAAPRDKKKGKDTHYSHYFSLHIFGFCHANTPDLFALEIAEHMGGPPPWKRFQNQKKSVGRLAEATLESVWARTEWPSDEVISSLWDLHRIRREQVIEWFQQKRRGSRGVSQTVGSEKSGTRLEDKDNAENAEKDWDTEWDAVDYSENK